jgi:hypothetical protein
VQEIYLRQTGSSSWIIDSAIKNPNIILVCENFRMSNTMKSIFFEKKKQLSFFKKILYYLKFRNLSPEFISIDNLNDNFFRGRNKTKPIIYDNSVVFSNKLPIQLQVR